MIIFRLLASLYNYLVRRIFPYNLRPDFILGQIRLRLETWVAKLDHIDEKRFRDAKPKAVPWTWYFIHFCILAVGTVGLWYLNSALDLDKLLRSPWPFLHSFWLPILFVLGYVLYWLGYGLWKLLGPEKSPSEFPDIEEAWDEAVTALRQARIDIDQAPLFLVLGRPSGSLKQLFDASQMTFAVRHIPRRPEAPLHVTASPEGIFVSCEGASLLGRQIALLLENGSGPPSDNGESRSELPPVIETEESPSTTAAAMEPSTEVAPVLLLADTETSEALRLRQNRIPLLKQNDEVERLTARLQHLCRLIVNSRQPYCPVNGVLVVLPLAATNSVEDASQTGAVLQHDLTTARATLQVHCPVLVALADMEQVPGFCEMLEQFPEARQRQYVLGQPFPLVPDLEATEIPHTIGKGVRWLFETLLPSNVYKLLRVEPAGSGQRSSTIHANGQLLQLLVQMRERHLRLHHILTRSLTVPEHGPLLFGGVFLVATGPDPAQEQAFVHGVLRQMIDNQNYVSWTKEALEEEAVYSRWTRLGYLALLVLVVTVGTVMYQYWPRK